MMKNYFISFAIKSVFPCLAIIAFVLTPGFTGVSAMASPILQATSLADVIEPLMPAVVNIHTVKYNRKAHGQQATPLPEVIPFEQFSDFFRQFNVPFAFDLYSSPRATSLGSGFIIDETGLIVTNHHVISGSDEIYVKLADNTELPATVIGRDPKTDLALIKIESAKKLPFVSFGDSARARVGDAVIAIGNSLGFGGTVTAGIISSKGRDLGSGLDELVDDFIQTDAAINTGNSGGPLFNIEGKVIGVNTSIPAVAGGTNVGIGFAIPSNRVQNIITQLKTSGKISRGKLDIAIQEITKELSEAMNLHKDYGVLVVEVKAGGAGDKAGLKGGDLITEFNGKKVLNSRKLQLLVAETQVGEEAVLTVIRKGETVTLKAKIVGAEEEDEEEKFPAIKKPTPKNPDKKNLLEKSGIVFTNLTDELKEKFNIEKTVKGIFVVEVKNDNTAPDLRLGDMILAINQEPIRNISEFNDIYEKLKSSNKKNAILLVKRREFSMFIALPIK